MKFWLPEYSNERIYIKEKLKKIKLNDREISFECKIASNVNKNNRSDFFRKISFAIQENLFQDEDDNNTQCLTDNAKKSNFKLVPKKTTFKMKKK